MEHQSAEVQVTQETPAVTAEKQRDNGVYAIIVKKSDGNVDIVESVTKREASIAYTQIVEEHGPNSVLRFYKQAKVVNVKVKTKTITSF